MLQIFTRNLVVTYMQTKQTGYVGSNPTFPAVNGKWSKRV